MFKPAGHRPTPRAGNETLVEVRGPFAVHAPIGLPNALDAPWERWSESRSAVDDLRVAAPGYDIAFVLFFTLL